MLKQTPPFPGGVFVSVDRPLPPVFWRQHLDFIGLAGCQQKFSKIR
ncbi:hypothetical protein [Pseudomonas sp. NBRC 111124]|nr:hypothetical protein [Pseudomonas sp. NBRC 111124]